MNLSRVRYLFTGLLTVVFGLALAQQYNFHTYTVEDGLPQTQVRGMYQDRTGNLWIGTQGGGVSRYNGKKYVNYSSINRLCDNNVTVITGDKWGYIWIGTNQGLSRFNGVSFKTFTTKSGLVNNQINALCTDNQSNIWVGTDQGLCILVSTDSTHSFYRFAKYFQKDGLPSDKINSLFQDNKGNIWIGTDNGVVLVEKSKEIDHVRFTIVSDKEGLITNGVTSITQDHNEFIWIATENGVSKLVSRAGGVFKFENYTLRAGLLSNKVNCVLADTAGSIWLCSDLGLTRLIFENNSSALPLLSVVNYTYHSGLAEGPVFSAIEDREKNLWFGTENGLSCYGGDRFLSYTKSQGLLNNTVLSITGEKDGNLLVGTDEGLCKLQFSGDTGHFVNFSRNYNLKQNASIKAVLQDRENNIWIGTAGEVIKMEPGRSGTAESFKVSTFSNPEYFGGIIYGILEDSKGNVWFATSTGLVSYSNSEFKKYTKSDGLSDNSVKCLLEDHKGMLWVGTEKGLCSFDGKRFTKFGSYSGLKLQVTSIVEDEAGNLWLGSYNGEGLTRFDGANYVNISEADGLISNTVYLLMIDNSGVLWVGTNKGLDQINVDYFNHTDSIRIKHYSKSEGFTGIQCNQNAVYKDFSGNIWFGTVKGIVKYNPKENIENKMAPVIQLTGIKLFNREDVNWSKYSDSINPANGFPVHLRLPYDQNFLSFSFLGVSLTNPEKVRYKYKLSGFSEEWSEDIAETTAPFPNLPYGDYTFYVKACNSDQVWNKPVSFHFYISPPFWKTAWFYIFCVVVSVCFIWIFILWRTRQLNKSKKELENKIADRTRELQEKNIELEKLSIVARETVNAIAIGSQTGEIEWVNESFTRMTGYNLLDLKEGKAKTIYQVNYNPELKKIVLSCVSSRQSKVYESMVETKDGNHIWMHTTLTPIFDENGKVKKLVFVDTDLTETKKAEEIIRQKNKDMMDSINYAKLIQDAILPPKGEILRLFPESFLLFKPREVVSGDFYWFTIAGDLVYLAVADSTGHGVPGAFMSLIGSSLLNEIVIQKRILETDKILNELDAEIRKVLKQGNNGEGARDGMDVALCTINLKTKELTFSGAMRPLYIVNSTDENPADKKFKLEEIVPNKRSIGGDQQGRVAVFSANKIKLKKGDAVYLFTDGYADQFGGPKGKKITNTRFKEALLSLQVLSMNLQGNLLEQDFLKWKGELEQVDDVLVIGIKF